MAGAASKDVGVEVSVLERYKRHMLKVMVRVKYRVINCHPVF